MTPDVLIFDLLNEHLILFTKEGPSVSGYIPVAWPGIEFRLGNYSSYVRPRLLPARSAASGLGTAANNDHTGIYQVDVFWTENKGESLAFARAGEIALHFKRGTRLADNGYVVSVNDPPSLSPSLTANGFVQVPVSIPYWAEMPNGVIP